MCDELNSASTAVYMYPCLFCLDRHRFRKGHFNNEHRRSNKGQISYIVYSQKSNLNNQKFRVHNYNMKTR
jgi:hypothetical protein